MCIIYIMKFKKDDNMIKFYKLCCLAISIWIAMLPLIAEANGFIKIKELPTHQLRNGKVELGKIYDAIEFDEPDGIKIQFKEDNENHIFSVSCNNTVIAQYFDIYVPIVRQIKDLDTGKIFYVLYMTSNPTTKECAHIIIGYDRINNTCVTYMDSRDYYFPANKYTEVLCYNRTNRLIMYSHRKYDDAIEGYQLIWDEKTNDFKKQRFVIDMVEMINDTLNQANLNPETNTNNNFPLQSFNIDKI